MSRNLPTKRDVIAHLRAQREDLIQQLDACEHALMAYGVKINGRSAPPRRLPAPVSTRVLDPASVEAEIIRVLSEYKHPLTVTDVHELGTFTCTVSGLYHAARRHSEIQLIPYVGTNHGKATQVLSLAKWGHTEWGD